MCDNKYCANPLPAGEGKGEGAKTVDTGLRPTENPLSRWARKSTTLVGLMLRFSTYATSELTF